MKNTFQLSFKKSTAIAAKWPNVLGIYPQGDEAPIRIEQII